MFPTGLIGRSHRGAHICERWELRITGRCLEEDLGGATFYDEEEHVVWLLAYGRHRSGDSSDFFPYCKKLDKDDRLLPSESDYERMFDDRGHRFVDGLVIEAPLALKQARDNPGEHRLILGGKMGAAIAVEVASEAEATTIAFRKETLDWDLVPLVLTTFHAEPEGSWEDTDALPSRSLNDGEMAFIHVHESGT